MTIDWALGYTLISEQCLFRLSLSPGERREKGGNKFYWKKNTTCTCIWCQKICLSVFYKLWPQLSQDWQNRMAWNFFRTSLAKWMFSKIFICPKRGRQGQGRGPKQHFWQEIISLTRPICRGAWNLPHKFHLYSNEIIWK